MTSRTVRLAAIALAAALAPAWHLAAPDRPAGPPAPASPLHLPLCLQDLPPRAASPVAPAPVTAPAPATDLPPLSLGIAALECAGRDEFVLLANHGTTTGDLAGWRLVSVEGGQVYTFSPRLLAPGETVALHSGPGAPPTGGADIRWTLSYVWNNASDRAQLLSPTGALVQEEDC